MDILRSDTNQFLCFILHECDIFQRQRRAALLAIVRVTKRCSGRLVSALTRLATRLLSGDSCQPTLTERSCCSWPTATGSRDSRVTGRARSHVCISPANLPISGTTVRVTSIGVPSVNWTYCNVSKLNASRSIQQSVLGHKLSSPTDCVSLGQGESVELHHHHHHFIYPIIQQYAHLHRYNLEEQDSKVRQEH